MEIQEKKVRESNLELLKIIAMFLICLSHVVNVFNGIENTNPYTLTFNGIFGLLVKNFGWFGDYIFIACSAYFLAFSKQFNIKKMLTYYIGCALIFILYLVVFKIIGISIPENLFIKTITTYEVFSYWYIKNYLIYLLILPLISLIIEKINQKTHKILIIVLLIIQEIAMLLKSIDVSIVPLVYVFISMQFIMSYGRKYGKYLFLKEDDKKKASIGLLLIIIFWIIKDILITYIGSNHNIVFKDAFGATERLSILYVIFGVDIFILFKNINIKHNKTINFISSLSLLFYLIHHNEFLSLVLDSPFNDILINYSSSLRPLVFLLGGLIRYIYGILVSILFYFVIFKPLKKLMDIIFNRNRNK